MLLRWLLLLVGVQGDAPLYPFDVECHDIQDDSICCPIDSKTHARCGGAVRGSCVNLTDFEDELLTPDSSWFPFSQICRCKFPFTGVSCQDCVPGLTGPRCDTPVAPRARKPVHLLTPAEFSQLVQVFQLMHETLDHEFVLPDGSIGTSLGWISSFHSWSVCGSPGGCSSMLGNSDFAHATTAFIAWHRAFLLFVENRARILLEDPDFTLPYWNWTDAAANSFILSSHGFGGDGNPGQNFSITDGPFVNFSTFDYRGKKTGAPIQRHFGTFPGVDSLPTPADVEYCLQMEIFDIAPWDENATSFRNCLEGWISAPGRGKGLHNRAHLWVGGTLVDVPTSPSDPLFFLHHCFVDLLAEAWQQRHLQVPYAPVGESDRKYWNRRDVALRGFLPLVTPGSFHKPVMAFNYYYEGLDTPAAAWVSGNWTYNSLLNQADAMPLDSLGFGQGEIRLAVSDGYVSGTQYMPGISTTLNLTGTFDPITSRLLFTVSGTVQLPKLAPEMWSYSFNGQAQDPFVNGVCQTPAFTGSVVRNLAHRGTDGSMHPAGLVASWYMVKRNVKLTFPNGTRCPPSLDPPSTPPADNEPKSSLNIAAVVLGVLLGLTFLALVVVACCFHKQRGARVANA